jgi:hypothetical protein
MTAHAHDPAGHADTARPDAPAGTGAATVLARPRWLVPGLAVGLVVAALLVAGVVSLSTVLYVGLFGGMILMHVGGHGGHGGHAGHGGRTTPDAPDPGAAASGTREDEAPTSRGCH